MSITIINFRHFLLDMDRSNSLSRSRNKRDNSQSVCTFWVACQSTCPFLVKKVDVLWKRGKKYVGPRGTKAIRWYEHPQISLYVRVCPRVNGEPRLAKRDKLCLICIISRATARVPVTSNVTLAEKSFSNSRTLLCSTHPACNFGMVITHCFNAAVLTVDSQS